MSTDNLRVPDKAGMGTESAHDPLRVMVEERIGLKGGGYCTMRWNRIPTVRDLTSLRKYIDLRIADELDAAPSQDTVRATVSGSNEQNGAGVDDGGRA